MKIEDVKRVAAMLPVFVQMAEVDLGEEEHEIETPLTYKQYQEVEQLIQQLQTLSNFVDVSIFNDEEDDQLPGTVEE